MKWKKGKKYIKGKRNKIQNEREKEKKQINKPWTKEITRNIKWK